jgi:hypothetical protein
MFTKILADNKDNIINKHQDGKKDDKKEAILVTAGNVY